ncbi:hypothetical protein ALC60_01920 [Trachymyrmex zeteki]|uniref:Uncharacterized protein n=1 Tax=Mycetomoellerius zeteki TaxID=64791 RepID=A0A151XFH3_9HYME|nr:hypothetical protein ALC60_01920 [Trachymyrmex zeteki]
MAFIRFGSEEGGESEGRLTGTTTVAVTTFVDRGSDELLSQSGAVSNGASMSPQPHHAADNNNDAKKVSGFN